jgi:hypothetical protein
MPLKVTQLEDRCVPAGFGGFGFGFGHGLGRILNSANPTDLNKLLTDVQGIINRQVAASQFTTLLSDAQTLATNVPAAAQPAATTLVTTIQTSETDGQITRQEKFDIQAAAQTVFVDLHGTGTARTVTQPIRQDLRALNQAFAPTAADRSLIRGDIKTIWQNSLSHFHSFWD